MKITGALYFNGEGVEKDEKKAYEYLYEAVHQNVTEAYYNFAIVSQSLGEDIRTVRKYIATAAEHGNSLALFHHGKFSP